MSSLECMAVLFEYRDKLLVVLSFTFFYSTLLDELESEEEFPEEELSFSLVFSEF
jgi:hypothetical protein